jgi:hypothetical protein
MTGMQNWWSQSLKCTGAGRYYITSAGSYSATNYAMMAMYEGLVQFGDPGTYVFIYLVQTDTFPPTARFGIQSGYLATSSTYGALQMTRGVDGTIDGGPLPLVGTATSFPHNVSAQLYYSATLTGTGIYTTAASTVPQVILHAGLADLGTPSMVVYIRKAPTPLFLLASYFRGVQSLGASTWSNIYSVTLGQNDALTTDMFGIRTEAQYTPGALAGTGLYAPAASVSRAVFHAGLTNIGDPARMMYIFTVASRPYYLASSRADVVSEPAVGSAGYMVWTQPTLPACMLGSSWHVARVRSVDASANGPVFGPYVNASYRTGQVYTNESRVSAVIVHNGMTARNRDVTVNISWVDVNFKTTFDPSYNNSIASYSYTVPRNWSQSYPTFGGQVFEKSLCGFITATVSSSISRPTPSQSHSPTADPTISRTRSGPTESQSRSQTADPSMTRTWSYKHFTYSKSTGSNSITAPRSRSFSRSGGSRTRTAALTVTRTLSQSASYTVAATATATGVATATATVSAAATATVTALPTRTITGPQTATVSRPLTDSRTGGTRTRSPPVTQSHSVSQTQRTLSATHSLPPTASHSISQTLGVTQTLTLVPTASATHAPTSSRSSTETEPLTLSAVISLSNSIALSRSASQSLAVTASRTAARTESRSQSATAMPDFGPTLNVSDAAVRNATTSGTSLVVKASALVSLADWVFASSLPIVGIVVDVELDTTAGGTRYGPSPKTSCVVQPGNIPCVAVYSTGYGPAKCALPDVAATTEVFTIACSFSLPAYPASTLGATPIVFNASCSKCGAPVSGNTTFSHSADSSAVTGAPDGGAVSSRSRVASNGAAFTASCDGDAAAAVAVFPITVIVCVVVVIARGVWFAVVSRRSSETTIKRADDGSDSTGNSNRKDFQFGQRRLSSASAAVVQAPTVSVRHGLVPLHAWAGLVLPFHSHTAMQQAAVFATQIVASGAVTAGVMEAAGVNDAGAGALGTSPLTLTVIVAVGAPIIAAVAVRTPLHLLLMWHRIRDRRRYYVKSFDVPSERHAARHQTAALWTPRAGPKRQRAPANNMSASTFSFGSFSFPASNLPTPYAAVAEATTVPREQDPQGAFSARDSIAGDSASRDEDVGEQPSPLSNGSGAMLSLPAALRPRGSISSGSGSAAAGPRGAAPAVDPLDHPTTESNRLTPPTTMLPAPQLGAETNNAKDAMLKAPAALKGTSSPLASAYDLGQNCDTVRAETEETDSHRRQRRAAMLAAVPTHATHVRVSAYRSTAAAMGLALVLFVTAAVGGVLATRDWCAAAQARYNAAFAAVLAVDCLVASPLWVALLYLYRWVMAEPRVVVHGPRGARGSLGSGNASSGPQLPSMVPTATEQQQGEITATVEHEPYPIHNAWRRG